MVAADSARIVFSAAQRRSAPPAIRISSSVPTMRSQSASTVLQVLRDALRLDVAFFAGGVAGEAPEVRAIVDVEDDLAAGGARNAHGLALGRFGVGLGEMRAGDEDGARPRR